MNECFGVALSFLVPGSIMLLLSLTRTGRKLTSGYNRLPLPRRIRKGPIGDAVANVLVACAGVVFSIIGLVGSYLSFWLSGRLC